MGSPNAELQNDPSVLEQYRDDWIRLFGESGEGESSYEEYCDILVGGNFDAQMRLVILRNGLEVQALAPFLLTSEGKSFSLGERRLFSLPVRLLQPFKNSLLENLDIRQLRVIFDILGSPSDFDLVKFGEIELDGRLHRALVEAFHGSGWRLKHASHMINIHWLIDLPSSFEDYLSGFSSKTRQKLKGYIKKLSATNGEGVDIITQPDQVDAFLEEGERISRLTYQWHVGRRLVKDELTRNAFYKLAKRGILRCHLLYANGGKPCAFACGVIRGEIYHYEVMGFDPCFKSASPGTALTLKLIEDLITNTSCKILDFGMGGDTTGYKSRLGNRSYKAILLEAGKRMRPYTMLLFALQETLSKLKQFGNAVLSDKLKQTIKRRLRRYNAE